MKVEALPQLIPAAGQVLVRVRAIGINPAETYARAGAEGYARPASGYPFTPGNDATGEVTAVGAGVDGFAPGDKVYTLRTVSGSYAEYTLAEAKFVKHIPGGLDFRHAAALPVPYFTAYRALFSKLKIAPGKSVLVHGATGGVGMACIQFARAAGCTVIASAGNDAGAAAVAPWAHTVVRHGSAAVVEQVMAATNGAGVDGIVEMLANANLDHDCKMVAMHGTIAVVGSRGSVSIAPRDLMRKDASITGVMLWHSTDAELEAAARAIADGVARGELKPVVGKVFTGECSCFSLPLWWHLLGRHGRFIPFRGLCMHVISSTVCFSTAGPASLLRDSSALAGLESAPAAHVEVIEHAGGSQGKIVIEVP